MAGKLGYKFVNPALTGDEKAAVASAGLPVKKLPHTKLLLGLNRAGATTNSIYNLVKSLKGLEEVRAISLKEDEVDERRARRRAKDEAAEERQESPIIPKDEKEGMKDGEEKIKKNKKSKGLLEKIFGPILNLLAPFIKFIAITSTLKWFADPKNKEKVERLVEFLGEIFKFLFKWGTFGVTNILDGLGKVFGGVGKFKEGNILGGAWDSMMGFGQLLVGLIALKGLALFLNPFKLMGGILDMLGVLGDDAATGGGDCGPDVDSPNKPKGRKPKGFLQRLRQRARIAVKRLRRYFKRVLPLLMRQISKLAKQFAVRIGKLVTNLMAKVAKPLVKTVIEGAAKLIPPGAKKVIGEATQKVVKGAADILPAVTKRATDFKNWATKGIQTGVGWLRTKGSDVLKFAADKWKTLKDGAVAQAQKVVAGAKGFGDNLLKGAAALKDKGEKAVVEHILGPLKSQADNLIAKSPVLQQVLGLFKGAGKQGLGDAASSAFKKFIGFVKPVAEPLARTLKGLNLPVIDTVIEGLFALYDLKSGVPPVRVALKLGGSLAGLALGATITGGATFFSGGLGAFLAPVLIGASQWGGEWLGDRVADMLGIPTNNNEKFGKGGIITERAVVEVAEAGEPEAIIPISQLESMIGANSSIMPGAPYLIGGMASFVDSLGQFPGVSDMKGELNTLANAFDATGFAVARDETIKNAQIANVDAATTGPIAGGSGLNLAALLAGMNTAMGGSEEEEGQQKQQQQTSGGGGDTSGGGGDTTTPEAGGGAPVSGEFGKRVSALLGSYEGLRLEAYPDAIYGWGVPTIGIGATYYPSGFRLKGKVKRGDKITKDEAYEIKSKHVATFISKIKNEVGAGVYDKLPEKVKAPLISKAFNYGSLGGSLAKLVKAGDIGAIASYFRNTLAKHDGGVNAWRRKDEASVMSTGTSPRAKVSFASGGGSIGKVVIPSMTPSFSSGGSLESLSTAQLSKMLDPTMPGAKNPAVFAAARSARQSGKAEGLSGDALERRVLAATVRAMRSVQQGGPSTAPKISSPISGPTPGSSLKQTSAMVAKEKTTEQESPAIIPIPSLTPVAINKDSAPAATTPRFAASGKSGMQYRFTAY